MRIIFFLPLTCATITAAAQPDGLPTRFTNPCGMPPNDSADVTGDLVADLIIGGWSMGTDDEPSSTGSCTRYVGTLKGTMLLCALDRNGQRVPKAFVVGDTVPALDQGPRDDLRIPRFVLMEGAIPFLQWGYGHQSTKVVPTSGLDQQVFVFQTDRGDHAVRGAFTVEPRMDLRTARIAIRETREDQGPWIIQ